MNGPFGNRFPYTNFHEMNLDWMIQIAKDFLDQYTNIEETISQGLEDLDTKAQQLEELLQAWYDEHSQDIADQLADALADLNAWYTEHQGYLDAELQENLTAFNHAAELKAQETIASIPEDYTALSNHVTDIQNSITSNHFFVDSPVQSQTLRIWDYDRDKNLITVTNAAGFDFINVITYNDIMPDWVIPGKKVLIGINNLDAAPNIIFIDVYWKDSNDVQSHLPYITDYMLWTIPDDISAIAIRIATYATFTGIQRVQPYIMTMPEEIFNAAFNYIHFKYQGTPSADNPDFNNYKKPGYYGLQSGITYLNKPADINFSSGGILLVYDMFKDGRYLLQFLLSANSQEMKYIHIRRKDANDTWTTWVTTGGNDGGQTINNIFNEYNITYNATSYPTIGTDTNNYLAASGTTADRTSSIVSLLTQNSVCHLGPGDFYVNGLIMPEGTALIGSGPATRLIMTGTDEGFAVKMMSECIVQDLSICGVASGEIELVDICDPDLDPTYKIRHGILWQWEYTRYEAGETVTGHAPTRGMVSNVRINGFTGGAITGYDTGLATNTGMECNNVYAWNCNVGINMLYYSEFSKFTNVTCTHGYYGAINNGGSNVFVNCNFCRNVVGMLFDATINGAPNNTHASASDCIVGHIGDPMNTGIGIKMIGCHYGYNFSGMQLFFSSIYIEDCSGIVFDNCNFGKDYFDGQRYDKINIVNGDTILFSNNMFENDPVINISGNENVHFVNCYNRSSGAEIQPQ